MNILLRPLINEKSMNLVTQSQFSFEVDGSASKKVIEKIVEDKKAKKPVAEVPEKKISLEKRELILQFVEANKTRENMQIVFSRLLAQILILPQVTLM